MDNQPKRAMPLNDKIALVLGGTGGLGSSITRRLASEGCRVYATYRSESRLQRPAMPLTSVKLIRTDVTDEHQVHQLFETVIAESKAVHIVVNSVGGYLLRKPLTEVTSQEWDLMFSINLKSAFLCTSEALRRMNGQSYGRIVHISAMAGIRPLPERIPYSISKASVSLLTELVAQEVKGKELTINAIAPSVIATSSKLASALGEDTSKWVTPDQIADIVLSLCSPTAATINGTTIRAFGGL